MFSIELDGKRHAARTHLEALELLTGAGYADELVSMVLVMAYEDGSTDVLSSLADSAGKSHAVIIRFCNPKIYMERGFCPISYYVRCDPCNWTSRPTADYVEQLKFRTAHRRGL